MTTPKPRRNDPCPCGSGKKYKACHEALDAQQRRPPAPPARPANPLAREVQEAMAIVSDADVSRLSAALATLGTLLERKGPAEKALRFPQEAFDQRAEATLGALARGGGAQLDVGALRARLRESVVDQLVTARWVSGLEEALVRAAMEPGLTDAERTALCVGALLCSAVKRAGGERLKDLPVLDAVFDVQLREWSQRQGALIGQLEAFARALEAVPLPKALSEAAERGDMGAVQEHLEREPELASRLAMEAKERAAWVEARMREASTPSLFTPAEDIWLTAVLWEPLRAVRDATEATLRREQVARLVSKVREALDADFVAHLLARLRQQARDTALPEPTRAFFREAAVAFEAEPARMVLAALFNARQQPEGRSAEELVALADLRALSPWTPSALEPYRALMVAEGRPEDAERVRRAQEWLVSHPHPALPPVRSAPPQD